MFEPNPHLDRIVHLATLIFTAPKALLSLTDHTRQHIQARIGLPDAALPDAETFCHDVIRQDGIQIQTAPRLQVGARLITTGGRLLGTLCVLDDRARPDIGARETQALQDLAALAIEQLELRLDRQAQANRQAEAALIQDIQNVAAEPSSFDAAMRGASRRIVDAFGALICTLWEYRPGEDMAVPITMVTQDADTIDRCRMPPHRLDRPAFAALATAPSGTPWVTLEADDVQLAFAEDIGVGCLAAAALAVDDRRFVIGLGFAGSRTDLAEIAGRLGRLTPALRQVMQHHLADEQLTLLASALSATHDGVFISQCTGPEPETHRIVYANPAFCDQTGYSLSELIGRSPLLLHGPDSSLTERQRLFAAIRAWEPVRSEMRRHRRDGSSFWSEATIIPLRNESGRTTHWVAIQRDVTARHTELAMQRQREEHILASAEHLRRLSEQLIRTQRIARIGTWRRVEGSQMMEWSEAIYPMFGVSPDSFVPTIEAVTAMLHPEDRDAVLSMVTRAAAASTDYVQEYRIVWPDGTIRHLWSESQFERDPDGRITAFSGIVQDITRRKEAEAMLLRTEKLRSIGQLTGGIAHDFNNLLTVISVNLELLGDVLGPDSPGEELRATALRAAESGAVLTSNLLTFALRQPLQAKPVDVCQLLSDIRQLAMRSIGERHSIRLRCQDKLPLCLLDSAGFESVVLNLLVNGRDAMPNGGTLTITTGITRIGIDDPAPRCNLPAGTYVTISVIDTGKGIPAAQIERVFEPFFTTKPAGQGTGLGLSTVLGFIRQSGGDVELTSTQHVGTTVRLHLRAIPA